MLQIPRPKAQLTHVLRVGRQYFRPRGYGGGVGTLAQALPMTHSEAEQRALHTSFRGRPFVVEALAIPIRT